MNDAFGLCVYQGEEEEEAVGSIYLLVPFSLSTHTANILTYT